MTCLYHPDCWCLAIANIMHFPNKGNADATQILIFWRSNKNTVIVQLAMRSGRIRVNYYILAVIIPVV